MKSVVKSNTYYLPILLVVVFTSAYIGATFMDNPFVFNSLIWWIVGVFLLGFVYMIFKSFQKIPTITIINDTIQSASKESNIKIKISDIKTIERVKSRINGWYSKRGGLKIVNDTDEIVFPFHVYSNESELLRLIYQKENAKIEQNCSYGLENFQFIKYCYRSIASFYFVMALALVAILIFKEEVTMVGIVGVSILVLPLITIFFIHTKFLQVKKGYLYHFSPLLLKKCKYDLKNIEYANSESISTGRGAIKNLTIELADMRIITLIGGLNRQKEIDEIGEEINKKPKIA